MSHTNISTNVAKIKIVDEVNIMVVGLKGEHTNHFINKFAIYTEGYFFNPLYKLGRWDGKIKYFGKDGKTYLFLLDKILTDLKMFGYTLELEDLRTTRAYYPDPVDKDIFGHILHLDTGEPIELREHQVRAINSVLLDGNGIILASTSAGKTLVTAAICTVYGNMGLKTLTIVPSRDLIQQTKADYTNCLLDAGEYSGKFKNLDHQHIVSTWQALKNNPLLVNNFQVVIVDECLAGDTLITMSDFTTKQIQDIQPGDSVLSFNIVSNTFEPDVVIKTYTNMYKSKDEDMYELLFNDGTIISITGNHRLLTDRGLVRADELTEEDDVISINEQIPSYGIGIEVW